MRRKIKNSIQHQRPPSLLTLDETTGLILLTNLTGKEAVELLNHLYAKYPQAQKLVLVNQNNEKKLTVLRDEHRMLIEAGKNNLTLWGSLSKAFNSALAGVSAPVLINCDFSSSDMLHLVAANIKAGLKCGMFNPHGLPLYNPLITPEHDMKTEDFIETVNTYLKSLTGKSV